VAGVNHRGHRGTERGFGILGLSGQESGLTVVGSKQQCCLGPTTVLFESCNSVVFFGRAACKVDAASRRVERDGDVASTPQQGSGTKRGCEPQRVQGRGFWLLTSGFWA